MLMGAETEYALTVQDRRRGSPHDQDVSAHALFSMAAEHYPHLPTVEGRGIFFGNGGMLYVDVGGHPEYATPECASPDDLVRHILAGDVILGRAAADLAKRDRVRVTINRGNVGYGPEPQTWGCHESFLCRRSPSRYVEQLLPFMASRLIIAGSGGFNPFSAGIEFTLSPRSHFISTPANTETMRSRPLINLRDEPLSGTGSHRLHLVCGDSLGSETSLWLRAGTTALVLATLDSGAQAAGGLSLADPIGAMRTFAADPELTDTTPTTDGRRVTALDVQRHYLSCCARHFRRREIGHFPAWVPVLLEAWERALTALGEDPEALDCALDWRIKLAVYRDFSERNAVAWNSWPHWNAILKRLLSGGRFQSNAKMEELVRERGPMHDHAVALASVLGTHGLRWDDFPRMLQVRSKLLEIDTRFLQLDGLFRRLDGSGVLNHRVIENAADIERAVSEPPSGTRASLRGNFVRQNAGNPRYNAGWTALVDSRERTRALLDDPFAQSAEWTAIAKQDRTGFWTVEARSESLARYLRGDYAGARTLQMELLSAGYELPSTYCHIARIALTTDDIGEASEAARAAWEVRRDADAYIRPRIFWLLIALAMERGDAAALPPLMHEFRLALAGTSSNIWSIEPLLRRLEARRTSEEYALLAAMSAAISDHSRMAELEAFAEWREAEPRAAARS
jgi:hypothetical protein